MDYKCPMCDKSFYKTLSVKERMLGIGKFFIYNKCRFCGHTTLQNIPTPLNPYYPHDYYSFKPKVQLGSSENLKAFKSITVPKDAAILDYGCGSGQFVRELQKRGYKNARGYDPYLPSFDYRMGINIREKYMATSRFNVITLNHVIEHIIYPVQILNFLNELLLPGGILIIRTPVIDSQAFLEYKECWVQFDAPRHINIFSRNSLKLAIQKVYGLKIQKMYDDSTHFQFTGSERYKKGLSLKGNTLIKRLLSLSTYKYSLKAKKLNKISAGDQIVLICKKITP